MDLLRLGGAQIDLGQALVEEKDLKDPIDLGGAQSDLAQFLITAHPYLGVILAQRDERRILEGIAKE